MTTPRTRPRRTYAARIPEAQRRTELLDAALHLVVTQGHSAATMAAVADEAGVTKPVVYSLFANRAELLAALLEREQAGALAQMAAALPADLDDFAPDRLGGQLPQLLDGVLTAVRAAPERWRCIVVEMPDMPAEFHAARARAREVAVSMVQQLTARVLTEVDAPAALDAEITAHLVLGLLETAARLVLTDPEHFAPQRFAAALRSAVGMTLG